VQITKHFYKALWRLTFTSGGIFFTGRTGANFWVNFILVKNFLKSLALLWEKKEITSHPMI
jgi:hypothetical protein